MHVNILIDHEKLSECCRKWRIAELALFGSVLRDDFRPDSDVDVLVTFDPSGGITFDTRVEILEDLAAIFGRQVDLVEKGTIRNPFRRHSILTTNEVLYAA